MSVIQDMSIKQVYIQIGKESEFDHVFLNFYQSLILGLNY